MSEYHKIPTVYARDPATKHRTLIEGQYATPALELLAAIEWDWTEKIDGTNVRVIFDPATGVRFAGKSENAQMPMFLHDRLVEMFPVERLAEVLPDGGTVYGEGYGAKIQKGGGNYIPDGCSFIVFDVKVAGWWLERDDVVDVADKLLCEAVPIVGRGTLRAAVEYVQEPHTSWLSDDAMVEGLVMRLPTTLFDRKGDRIITKVKAKDFRR